MDDGTRQHEETPARWRYIGGVERVYPHVPVTVQQGAVIEHIGPPAEDCLWEDAGESEVTHRPDNETEPIAWPADIAAAAAAADDGGEQQQFELHEPDDSAGE